MPHTSQPENRPQTTEENTGPPLPLGHTGHETNARTVSPRPHSRTEPTHPDARNAAYAFDQSDNHESIALLIERWRPDIIRYLLSKSSTWTAQNVEDIVQEMRAKSRTTSMVYDPVLDRSNDGNMPSLLRTIAARTTIDLFRKDERHYKNTSLNEAIGPDGRGEVADFIADATSSPEELVVDSLQRVHLRGVFADLLANLPTAQAQELATAYDEGDASDSSSLTNARRAARYRGRKSIRNIIGLSDDAARDVTLWRKLDGSKRGLRFALADHLAKLPAHTRAAARSQLCTNLQAARQVLHNELGIDINIDAVLTFNPLLATEHTTITEED